MSKLKFFAIGFLLYVITRQKTKEPNKTVFTGGVTPTPTPATGGGTGGTGGGGGSGTNANYIFEFWQPSSQQNLVAVQLVSNSRVATQVYPTPANAIALLEYWIYDSNNNLVCHLKDDVGGHHPNFFDGASEAQFRTPEMIQRINLLRSSFVPVTPFSNYSDKCNNHLPYFNRNLPAGSYRWVVKNNGNTSQYLFAGYTDSETENLQVSHNLQAGGQESFDLNIVDRSGASFKINSNNIYL